MAAEALRGQDDGRRAVELAEAAVAGARAWDIPKAVAVALRARALVTGATADL